MDTIFIKYFIFVAKKYFILNSTAANNQTILSYKLQLQLTRRHRYVHHCSVSSTPLLHSVPANAARRPCVLGHVRMQHTVLSEDLRPDTLPVLPHRCSPHSCVDIQSTELSRQQVFLNSRNTTTRSSVLHDKTHCRQKYKTTGNSTYNQTHLCLNNSAAIISILHIAA